MLQYNLRVDLIMSSHMCATNILHKILPHSPAIVEELPYFVVE